MWCSAAARSDTPNARRPGLRKTQARSITGHSPLERDVHLFVAISSLIAGWCALCSW
jgi:hypothetical protein